MSSERRPSCTARRQRSHFTSVQLRQLDTTHSNTSTLKFELMHLIIAVVTIKHSRTASARDGVPAR